MGFKVSESISDWLRYIHNSGESLNWLTPYEENLILVLRRGLNQERQFRNAFQLLTLVFPYFALSLSHTEKWVPLLTDALLMAQDIKDDELQAKVFRWMGEANLKVGKHRSAREVLTIALQRAETGELDEIKAEVYIGFFKLQWFNLSENVTRTLAQKALEIASRLQNHALQADLFDSLASAYARLSDTTKALGFGQTAFAYWITVNNHAGIGRTAYNLASIYLHIGQLKDNKRFLNSAIAYLEIAYSELAYTDDLWQYPLLAYEQASIHFQLEEFEEAASWFEQSLLEAGRMNSPHYVVVAQHGLGLSQAKLKQFTSARHFLGLAYEHWNELNNSYEKANALAGLADLELDANNVAQAKDYISKGLQCVEELQEDKVRQFMTKQFQDIIARLY